MAEQSRDDIASSSASPPLKLPAGQAGFHAPLGCWSIPLGPRVNLIYQSDKMEFVVDNRVGLQPDRKCLPTGWSEAKYRPIPLYNILWAELSADSKTVVIDYATEAKKTRLRAAQLRVPVTNGDPATINKFLAFVLSKAYGKAKQRRRAYVLINPNAGPGEAARLFEREARPIFEAARMELTVVTTTHRNHAAELVRDMDVDAFDVVVACSGDGLPYEVFNGLGQRADAGRALGAMPVVMLPCGSGNAMACNLFGTHRPSFAALAIVKGVETPFDLVSITQEGVERKLSFLSQSLGLIADLDITTEGMRWMGGTRFTVGFFWLLWKKKLYPCDLAVKVEIDHKDGVREHYRNLAGAATGTLLAASEEGASEDSVRVSDRDSGYTGSGPDEHLGLPPLKYGTVQDKVPEGWETIPHEKLWSFYCGNMAYMSAGLDFFPAAMANDGLMDMVIVDGPVSVTEAAGIQLGVESGQYFDNPNVKYRKVSAYRLIPRAGGDPKGIISIDGERVDFKAFQAEIHPALGLTLSKAGGYENPGPPHWDKVKPRERLLA